MRAEAPTPVAARGAPEGVELKVPEVAHAPLVAILSEMVLARYREVVA